MYCVYTCIAGTHGKVLQAFKLYLEVVLFLFEFVNSELFALNAAFRCFLIGVTLMWLKSYYYSLFLEIIAVMYLLLSTNNNQFLSDANYGNLHKYLLV